ncbi:MAG: MBL fold metallo-hydrolase [Chloroflexota bacterium]|nr:MBL fold metallo-hydrolase [Chloroflexota bacterium]
MQIEEVADATYCIQTPLPGVAMDFVVYLIRAERGVLIEPGPSATTPAIQEGMKQLGMNDLSFIIPTHIHMDHAGGVGRLAELFPHSKVLLNPRGVKHIVDPTRLIESTRMAFGDDFDSLYGPILPVLESQVEVPADGDTINIGDRELKTINAPGHAPHHIVIFDQKTKGLFCGEALGTPPSNEGFLPLPAAAPPGFDVDDYLATIEKLKAFEPQILFYSHSGINREPEKTIPKVSQSTKIFGDLIRKSLMEGDNEETIKRKIRELGAPYFPREWGEAKLNMCITDMFRGYAMYFQKKGLN